jgi:hypothetical protein
MDEFYRFTAQDFERVPLDRVCVGDKIAWGIGHATLYGSVVIDDIFRISGGYAIGLVLPVGAKVTSGNNCAVSIDWENTDPIIRVTACFLDHKNDSPRLIQRG